MTFGGRSSPALALQWGRGLSTAERTGIDSRQAAGGDASMGPRSFNRGKLLWDAAAVFQPRKGQKENHHAKNSAASMGPRSFNRGKSLFQIFFTIAINASMGPRSFNRGKVNILLVGEFVREASMGPRSFNRGKLVITMPPRHGKSASMGPRSFNRGKFVRLGQLSWDKHMLQWGRGLSTAERFL